MKQTTRIVALIAMAITTVTHTALAQSRDEAAVRAASAAWQRYIAAQQTDSIVALHLPNAVVMMANTPPIMGSNGIRAGWANIVKLPNLSMHWTPQHIEMVSPTAAEEFGTYTDSYDGPNGKESDSGSYVTLWKKVNGKWRVALDAPVSSQPVAAVMTPDVSGDQLVDSSKIVYNDFTIPGFAPGVKLAVVHGNPMAKGDYTLRLMFPDGYKFPVHWHPGAEHVTVLSGTFLLAMGTSGDWSQVQAYGPGSFIYAPARHPHYGGARGVTVVQLHGDGPFALNIGVPK